jgi:hypothetical protein
MIRAGWDKYLKQLHNFLDQCANQTNALMLGIDSGRVARFKRSSPSVLWSMADTPIISHWNDYSPMTVEAFDELVDFLVDYALKSSEAYVPKFR